MAELKNNTSVAAILHNGDARDPKVVIVKKKLRMSSNTSTEGPWRLLSETKEKGESDYVALERGLMEELNVSYMKSMSKMLPNVKYPEMGYTFRYHLNGAEDTKNFVRVYVVGTTENAIKRIRPNLKELDGYMYTSPQQAFSRLSWDDEKMCVARFCDSKKYRVNDGMRKFLQLRKATYNNVRA